MTKTMPAHIRRRITLRLDSAVHSERRILERLDALPARSGTDWLRALLTQGLLAEECGLFADQLSGTSGPPSPTQKDPSRAAERASALEDGCPRAASTQVTADKPFAQLQEILR